MASFDNLRLNSKSFAPPPQHHKKHLSLLRSCLNKDIFFKGYIPPRLSWQWLSAGSICLLAVNLYDVLGNILHWFRDFEFRAVFFSSGRSGSWLSTDSFFFLIYEMSWHRESCGVLSSLLSPQFRIQTRSFRLRVKIREPSLLFYLVHPWWVEERRLILAFPKGCRTKENETQ